VQPRRKRKRRCDRYVVIVWRERVIADMPDRERVREHWHRRCTLLDARKRS